MINYKQFIKECKNSGKFDDYQMAEICKGFENGLTIKQVELYAKPEFNGTQMCQIRYSFEEGLTMEQVKLFAKLEFGWDEMDEIRLGFRKGLTMEEIKLYAKPKFNSYQMKQNREFIIKNRNIHINTLNFLIQLEVL